MKHFFLLLLMIIAHSQAALANEQSITERRNGAVQMIIDGEVDDAIFVLEDLANSGDTDSIVVLGSLLIRLERVPEAISLLEPLAVSGNSEAQWYLGSALRSATPPQLQQAEAWLRKAAAAGNPKAVALLRILRSMPQPVNGRIATPELIAILEAIISEKVAGLSEFAVDCYGAPKMELRSNMKMYLSACLAEQPREYQNSISESEASWFMNTLAQCVNASAFQQAGKSLSEMASCLGSR